jgi:hypothetical protein
MAEEIRIANEIQSPKFKYKSRLPYYNQVNHLNDNFLNLGYDYYGQLYKKTTSPELWGNPLQVPFIGRLEAMMTLILENVKSVKKTFSYAHDRETLKIN